MTNSSNLWNHFFRNNVAHDFSGRKMIKEHYGRHDLPTGWDIDHIIPKSKKNINSIDNLLIVNCETNAEKADKNTFYANGILFQVKKINGNHKIVKI
ncbi:MAG: HNH endonuclease domain-containing protein [Acholeplasma sp.]|nr:HNH endonuclease domain-containing protein [Acholeplasma sp.]